MILHIKVCLQVLGSTAAYVKKLYKLVSPEVSCTKLPHVMLLKSVMVGAED